MAKGREGLVGRREMPHDLKHPGMEANVFGRAATRDDDGIVVFRLNVLEGCVEGKIMSPFLRIGLVAFEIVNRGADDFARLLSGTNGVHGVTDH